MEQIGDVELMLSTAHRRLLCGYLAPGSRTMTERVEMFVEKKGCKVHDQQTFANGCFVVMMKGMHGVLIEIDRGGVPSSVPWKMFSFMAF